jgi:hypothetical protein
LEKSGEKKKTFLKGKIINLSEKIAKTRNRKINDESLTIGERLRNLFAMKGFKIATIVTAVILVISSSGAIVGSLFRGSPEASKKPDKPEKPASKIKE